MGRLNIGLPIFINYKNMRIKIKKSNKKGARIAVVGCVHGDELIGKKIIKKLEELKIIKGQLTTVIANERAVKNKKRFIDDDLNRSFPGIKGGNYEENLAYKFKHTLKQYDFVLDIHSTTTDTKSLIIITKINSRIKKVLDFITPKRVALMPLKFSKKSLNYHAGACISFEYGKDKSPQAFRETLDDVLGALSFFGLINKIKNDKRNKTEYFKITGTMRKKLIYKLEKIKNFKLIKKGQVVAKFKNKVIRARKDFYPILFGDEAYKEIFGFQAKKII